MDLKNKILGSIYGGILGDIIGMPLEFKTEKQIAEDFHELKHIEDTKPFLNAEYTDDTCQMLEVMKSLTQFKKINIKDIADRLYQWMVEDGRGIGYQTRSVLYTYGTKRTQNIQEIAREFWEKSDPKAAGNGGVMRTAPIGLFFHHNQKDLIEAATEVCKITHFDPRCWQSCIAICIGIAQLLHDNYDFATILSTLSDETLLKNLKWLKSEKMADLKMDGVNQGYTVLTTKIAFAALHEATSFEDGMLRVWRKGGDADTNGMVAGSLLGAKYGLNQIPKLWKECITQKHELDSLFETFFESISK